MAGMGRGRFDVKEPDTEALRAARERLKTPQQRMRDALAEKTRHANSPDEEWNEAFNAGRAAVLQSLLAVRDPLALLGITPEERQTLISVMDAAHRTYSVLGGDRANGITRIAHKLDLQR